MVGASQLKDYELLFRGSRGSAVATVEPKEGSTVPVLLWKIQERDEAFLDRYEGYPGHEFGIPSDYYVDTIWQGYESAGFDTQILEDAVEKAIELTRHQEQQEATEQTSLFGMGGIK